MRDRTIILTQPIEHEGRQMKAVHMRALTVGDLPAIAAIAEADAFTRLAQIIAIATDLPLQTLARLCQRDLDALAAAMSAMSNEAGEGGSALQNLLKRMN